MLRFIKIQDIVGKVSRTIKDFNEIDAIEDGIEALKLIFVPEAMQQIVKFLPVQNYEADIPKDLQRVVQIVKDNRYSTIQSKYCPTDKDTGEEEEQILNKCGAEDKTNCSPLFKAINLDFRTFSSLVTYKHNFSPVRLSDAKFFGSKVYEDYDPFDKARYEYTIIADTKFRFNFKEGYIALSYDKILTDNEDTPMVPDIPAVVNALTYYIMWKVAERNMWAGRQGYGDLVKYSYQNWEKYAGMAIAELKMPNTIDELQNLYENTSHILPPDEYNTLR